MVRSTIALEIVAYQPRQHGTPDQSEFTVIKVDAYNDIKSYLAECSETSIRSLEDVVAYNEANRGSEGAFANDHPAFPTGQVRILDDMSISA